MARAKKARKAAPSPVGDVVSITRLVTPEARAKGIYDYDSVEVGPCRVAIDKDGRKTSLPPAKVTVVRNRGATTLDRWYAISALDERQMRAIARYQWAHAVVIGGIPAQSAWPELSGIVARGGGLSAEDRLAVEDDARHQWDVMQVRVFRGLHRWYDCWQNVVLHDEPAGLAGGRLGFKGRDSAATSALCAVRFFADLIAEEFGL